MEIFRKKNFLELCAFNCSIAKLFGYFYFSLKTNQEKKDDCDLHVWFAVNVAFSLVASLKSSQVNLGRNTSSVIINMAIKIVIAQTLFMPTIFRVINFLARRRHEKILRNMQSIDGELRKMEININYSKHFAVAVALTLAYFAFVCLTFYIDNKLSLEYLDVSEIDQIAALLAAFNIIAYLSYQLNHMLLLFALYKRLQFMNLSLQENNLSVQLLKQIGIIHCKLSDTLDLMNKCFIVSLLSYFLQFIIYCMFYFFGFYHYLTSPDVTFSDFIVNTISFFYFLFFFWFGAWMVVVSSWIKSEGEETAAIIHSKVINDQRTRRACNDFCLQLHQIRPSVSCGLFRVDWLFLLSFISALFSYLVILVQFESG